MDTVLSILVLAAFALIAGAAYLWFAKNERKRPGLMLLLAVVMLMNVAIWTVPSADGNAPLDRIEQGPAD